MASDVTGADLLENLLFTPGRNAKLTLLADYFRTTPDPDRGWALAALAGTLNLPSITPTHIHNIINTAQ